ncbi:phage tail protein [Pectobacterium zantedeschiae]|uniref:phage tail protein n=1 Tax=Pectobacterium zantedeschiae TaxID=2034769 RepID=UPI0032ED014B
MQNPMPPVDTPDKAFHDGNPLTGELGTIVTALFMNNVQSAIRNVQAEVISVLADAGITVDPNKTDQLLAALKATFATNTNVNGRVPSTRTVNGKALSADITLNSVDVGALPAAGIAVAATKLATARNINGVPFDGTADIALVAARVGALAKDQDGADIQDKTQFRQNIGLLNNPVFAGAVTVDTKNAGVELGSKNLANTPFVDFNSSGNGNDYDARIIADGGANTSSGGSLRIYSNELFHNDVPIMSVGQYGFGGFGGKISMSDAEFLPFLRNTSNPTQIIRNDAINTIAKQYSPTLIMRADDLWTAISVGVSPDSTVAYGGISMATGNNDGTVTTKHELWTDKNLPAPFGALMNTGILHDCNLIPPGQTALCSAHAENGPGFYGIVFSAYGHNSLYVIQIAKAYGGNQFSYRARNGDVNQWTEWTHSWDSSNLKQPVTAVEIAGLPQLFPGAVAPSGWLKCNGQQFDTAQYPVLASRYPSGFLPDLRGEFVRGWDDGRGADAGRALLSAQGDEFRSHGHGNVPKYMYPGGDSDRGNAGFSWFSVDDIGTTGEAGGNETRPRNIAFNYIVRAA